MPRKPTPKALATEQRDSQALELRIAGASFDQIAKHLGFAQKSGAHHSVQRALAARRKIRDEMADELVELECARLDVYQLGIHKRATAGEPRAVEVALKLSERRSALLGLDAPKRSEISGPNGDAIQIDEEVHVEISVQERQQRILAIVDAARGRLDPPAEQPYGYLAPEHGTADGSVA